LGDIGQGIDDPSCNGADDKKRRQVVFAILAHLAAQAIHVELQAAVSLDGRTERRPIAVICAILLNP
jgi:hypothetical protein